VKKEKAYRNVRFDAKTISDADTAFFPSNAKRDYTTLSVKLSESETWHFDTLAEFLAAADQGRPSYSAYAENYTRYLSLDVHINETEVTVKAPTRNEVESIFSVFEKNADRCRLPHDQQPTPPLKIFIGHGGDAQWRDLKDHLHEKHGYAIEAYEIGAREGHAVRDILEEMLDQSSFALLVLTGEDETKDGALRARQNVVHESGLFQGRLGFSRAIILLEEGTEEFSNIAGLQQIRFSKGKIKESFGDVLAVLKREFG
jgi:predicted nucleotide-binding protein